MPARAIDTATRQLGGDACASEFRLVRADGSETWVMSCAAIVDQTISDPGDELTTVRGARAATG